MLGRSGMNITQQDMDEIVAIQFGNDIYFAQAAIDKVRELQDFTNLHPRSTFKFMAEMDLSPKWAEYAEYPTIFDLKEYIDVPEFSTKPSHD